MESSSRHWRTLCFVIAVLLMIVVVRKDSQITALKAQLATVQPTAVRGAIFIEPTDQPLDRVTWTDPSGNMHLLACGEPVADNLTGEMRLVSQYRVGKTIAKINFVIP